MAQQGFILVPHVKSEDKIQLAMLASRCRHRYINAIYWVGGENVSLHTLVTTFRYLSL